MDSRQRFAILKKNKERWTKQFDLTDGSGIYILERTEDGIKYAYIGQSKHVLTRLAEHLMGYQHIDLSLKKHGIWSKDNTTGWLVKEIPCAVEQLDIMEQAYIKEYAQTHQLRNHTTGSQGCGKKGIDQRPARGYYDGKEQGRSAICAEIRRLLKYIDITPKAGKLSARMYNKFFELIGVENDE